MTSVTTTIRQHGELAATYELLKAGHHPRLLTHLVRAGDLIRVRQGWYCLPTTPPPMQEAVRVGGRLSCISGCEFHGLWVRPSSILHVEVGPNVSRLRSRGDKRVRLRDVDRPRTIVHWSDSKHHGSRWALDVRNCLKRMALCRPPEETVAAADSALRSRLITLDQWHQDIRSLPQRLRQLLLRVDPESESIIESITRFRLQYLEITPRLQVKIPGVGRVDFVIGKRLVIEVDGRRFHTDPDKFEADRRRDARLSARGFRVLRFSYNQVMHRWFEVRTAILAAVARGDHLT